MSKGQSTSRRAKDDESWIRPDLPSRCTWSVNSTEISPHDNYREQMSRKHVLPSVLKAIGDTPMVHMSRLSKSEGVKCQLYAKCEYFNPGGSVKDRIGLRMIENAEKAGILKPGSTIIEPTSGNTGIGLALSAAVKGYRCIIVMPENNSAEKVDVLNALGAEIFRTPTSAAFDLPEADIGFAQQLQREISGSVVLEQFINPGNPLAHYDTTAEEIIEQCGGHIDMMVAAAGTGGTITGIGRKIKEKCPDCKIIGVDPYGSILAEPEELNEDEGQPHEVEGIGSDFIPTVLDRSVVDKWYKTEDKESLIMARKLIRVEGLLCGGSCGAITSAAIRACADLKEDQKCVVLLPDSIRNYMTKHLKDEWMEERGFYPGDGSLKKWWWDVKVRELDLNPAVGVLPSTTSSATLVIMKDQGLDQLPVVDQDGNVAGVITLANMKSNLTSGNISAEDPIEKIMYKNFETIKLNDDLRTLSRILQFDHFAIVTHDRLRCNLAKVVMEMGKASLRIEPMRGSRNVDGKYDKIYALVTSLDFCHYIATEAPTQ